MAAAKGWSESNYYIIIATHYKLITIAVGAYRDIHRQAKTRDLRPSWQQAHLHELPHDHMNAHMKPHQNGK